MDPSSVKSWVGLPCLALLQRLQGNDCKTESPDGWVVLQVPPTISLLIAVSLTGLNVCYAVVCMGGTCCHEGTSADKDAYYVLFGSVMLAI